MMIALLSILVASFPAPLRPDSPAPPQVYFTMLDTAGVSKLVTVQQLDSESIATTDLDGRRRTEPLSKVLMLRRATLQPPQMPRIATPAGEAPTVSPQGVLYTIDGQVIAGSMARGNGSKDVVMWRSPVAGTLRVPLELLRRLDCMYPPSPVRDGPKQTHDTLLLRNGDVISGFVDTIGDTVSIETGAAPSKQTVTLPLDRIEAVMLAQSQVVPKGTIVATRTGLVLQVQTLLLQDRKASGKVALGAKNEQISLSDSEIETLIIDASRALPLALCQFRNAVGNTDRTWAQPLEYRNIQRGGYAAEIDLPGPMQVDCEIPKNSSRFVFHAELPHSCRTWGDPELVVSAGDGKTFKELKRVKLSGDAPEADGNLELAGATVLRLKVEPGTGGPIQDHVTLKQAIVILDAATSGRPAPSQ